MKPAFWCALGLVLYCYLGYPALIRLLSWLRPRLWVRAPFAGSVSIIMAVHNGERYLPSRLEALLALSDRRIEEILLVSDGSTDGTARQLLAAASSDGRCRSILLPEHRGKAVALNAGMAAATADLLLFVDVRPEFTPESLDQLFSNFADPRVGCAAGELVLERDGRGGTASAVSGLYWRYEQWIRRSEAAWDSPVGVYGGFYAVRRTLATSFPEGTILDDMYQPLAIVRQGYRSVLDSNAPVYDVWPERVSSEFDRKVRTLAGNFQLFQFAPWLFSFRNRLLFQLVSHKALRLIVPYCFLLLFVTSLALSRNSLLYAFFAAAQTALWALAAASLRFSVPLLSRAGGASGALLVLNAAAVVGLYRFLFTREHLWKLWKTPQASVEAGERLQELGGVR